MTRIVVPVDLGSRRYSIEISAGLLGQLADRLAAQDISLSHAVIVTDENVGPHYLELVASQISQTCSRVDSIMIPAGEASKSIAQCEKIWNQLQTFRADRSSTIVALGGGVVGDLAGFIAATYGRGLSFIQIPTTLLAQVDSSVGGKTGINLPTAKNMVGSFWQPETVMIDTDVLKTLDQANFRAGLAEVVKYGVIMDEAFFSFLEQNCSAINERKDHEVAELIAWSCRCKAQVVEEDERETSGRRAILNYGHTFGHAIENVFGYGTYLHGEAVAIGMNCAARMAEQLGMVELEMVKRQNDLLQELGLQIESPAEKHPQLIEAMKLDKKVAASQLRLILPTRIGHVELVDAPEDEAIAQCWASSTRAG